MKKRTLIAFPILLLPFLTANSPAPFPTTESYSDFNANIEFVEYKDYFFYFDVTIENYGNGYIKSDYLFDSDYYRNLNLDTPNLFYKEIIPPNSTYKARYKYSGKKEEILNVTNWQMDTYAIIDDSVTFSSPSFRKLGENSYEFVASIGNKDDYYYDAIVTFDYLGEEHSVYIELNKSKYLLESVSDIDVKNIEIKNIVAARSSYHIYKNGFNSSIYIGIAVFIFIFAIIVVLPILLLIIVVSLVIRKKNKIKNKNIDKSANSNNDNGN